MTGNVWFITGATSGFGKHIALVALRRGDNVVATARTATKSLGDLAALGALVLDLDVTAPDAELQAALDQGVARFGYLTHFINAAAYILEGPVEGASREDVERIFNTNVLSVINLSRLEVALLRRQQAAGRRGGVIANFGSLGSWTGGAAWTHYGATKWAVSGFTEGLAVEARALGFAAVCIEPGYFRTGLLRAGGGNRLFVSDPLDAVYADTAVGEARRALDGVNSRQPGDVVKGCRVIVDVLTGTGVAQGKEIPLRLVLGTDIVGAIREKLAATEALLKEWEDISLSTDHDDVKKAA